MDPLITIGVDPGVTDPTGVVAILQRPFGRPSMILQRTSVRLGRDLTHKLGEQPPGPQLEVALMAARAAFEQVERYWHALVTNYAATHTLTVVLEVYEDQGPRMKQSSGRYRLPYMIGALALHLRERGIPYQAQTAGQVFRPSSVGGTFRSHPGIARAAVQGWDTLRNDHERAAASHAEFFNRARTSLAR